ncbi:MAG: hypothetical protein D6798_12675, partial [Deltaproteobacteria bacterium]
MTDDLHTDRTVVATLAGLALLLLGLTGAAPPAGAGPDDSAPTDPATARGDVDRELDGEALDGADPPPPVVVDTPTLLLESGGLRVEQQTWQWGEASGQAWRVSVPLPGRAEVHPADTVTPFTELLPDDPGPWAAINGGFYERGAMGLVVADGVEHTPLSPRGGSGIFSWSPTEGPRIRHRSAWTPGPPTALQSIDRIVDAGHSLVRRRPTARSAARSAVAISADRLWLVALADHAS